MYIMHLKNSQNTLSWKNSEKELFIVLLYESNGFSRMQF